MVKLLEIKDIQDIYIVGMDFDGKSLATVNITDDFCSILTFNGKKKQRIETDGSAHIIAEAEFVKHYDRIHKSYDTSDDDMVYVKLPNFTGEINLQVFGDDSGQDMLTNENYTPGTFLAQIDYEEEFEDYYADALISFKSNTLKGKVYDAF